MRIERFEKIRLFFLDLDGTFYVDDNLLPGAEEFYRTVQKNGKKIVFLTNNSSKTAAEYLSKFHSLGIPATREQIWTSADATLQFVRKQPWKRLMILAPPSVVTEYIKQGYEVTWKDPDAALLCFDTTLTYEKLKKFCLNLHTGIPYIATHPDVNCPSKEGMIPDAGAFMACIAKSTGRLPDRIIGKPNKEFLLSALDKAGESAKDAAMIGDRLDTDIRCARNAGVLSVLVLTGETDRDMLENSKDKPDFVVESILSLLPYI